MSEQKMKKRKVARCPECDCAAGRHTNVCSQSKSKDCQPLTNSGCAAPCESACTCAEEEAKRNRAYNREQLKSADTPEELTLWIWRKYVGVPVAGEAWRQEYENLLDRVRRMHRSSFTMGLHEAMRQFKQVKTERDAQRSIKEAEKKILLQEIETSTALRGLCRELAVGLEKIAAQLSIFTTPDDPKELRSRILRMSEALLSRPEVVKLLEKEKS